MTLSEALVPGQRALSCQIFSAQGEVEARVLSWMSPFPKRSAALEAEVGVLSSFLPRRPVAEEGDGRWEAPGGLLGPGLAPA